MASYLKKCLTVRLALLEEILQSLARLKKETDIPSHQDRTSRPLAGVANITFVSCLEMEPQRMKGYCGTSPEYQDLWNRRLKPLKTCFSASPRRQKGLQPHLLHKPNL
ncbi:MAG: hypothetical protein DRI93_02900 [Aquificota bacterium]|nr:MAG: hypothetical protein DRI93_02900 [Aquificota bacterium]